MAPQKSPRIVENNSNMALKESSLDEKIERANQRLYYNRLKQRTPPPATEPVS